MTEPPTARLLRCELCDEPVHAASPAHVRMAAVDHMIDAHRLRWLADGITAAMTLVHVAN